jgi:hypothetical protein
MELLMSSTWLSLLPALPSLMSLIRWRPELPGAGCCRTRIPETRSGSASVKGLPYASLRATVAVVVPPAVANVMSDEHAHTLVVYEMR